MNILSPVRSACVWFGLVIFLTPTRLFRLSGLYTTVYPIRGPLRCHLSGSSQVTRISVDETAWDLTWRGGPVGGPGGIWTQIGVSGDQPAVLCIETLNRYHTPKSADRIERDQFTENNNQETNSESKKTWKWLTKGWRTDRPIARPTNQTSENQSCCNGWLPNVTNFKMQVYEWADGFGIGKQKENVERESRQHFFVHNSVLLAGETRLSL